MTSRDAPIIRALVLAVVAALSAGCNHAIFGPDYALNVSNDTSIALKVVVNDRALTNVEPGDGMIVHAGEMPALPWTIVVTTTSGRALLTLPVADGSVVDERAMDGTGSYSAPAARVDLSCGTIRVYVGDVMPGGPAPGPGTAGDCDP